MKRFAARIAPILCLVILAAASAAAEVATRPLFQWQVRSETATVTMVGSIHVGQADFFPLPAPFEEAFTAADALAVEVDATSPENVQKVMGMMMQDGMLPEGKTLKDRLSPELYARLEKFAAEKGEPLAMYARFKPGILALVLVMNEYQRQGFDAELGIDKHFLDRAKEVEKPILELETIEDQMQLFLEIDDELDDLLLDETLDQMDDLAAQTARMVALWKEGDVEGLNLFLEEQIGSEESIQDFYRQLLDERNVKMAEKIDAWLDGDRDIYVVVGAGHFSGEKGLVSLLRDRGWTVEQARAPLR